MTRRRSPLWKYVHPVRYLKAEARIARRQMSPARALGRVFSVPEIKAALRTQTTHVTGEMRRKQAEAWDQAAKKSVTRKAVQPAKKQVLARGKGGRFDGSRSMADRDREAWQRAMGGAVDPALLPRTPRRKPADR